jgi:hypothetical protein
MPVSAKHSSEAQTKPSTYEAVSRVFPGRVACPDLRLFQAFAKRRGAVHVLRRAVPHLLGQLLMEIDDAMSAQALPNLNVIDCHHRLLSDFFFK